MGNGFNSHGNVMEKNLCAYTPDIVPRFKKNQYFGDKYNTNLKDIFSAFSPCYLAVDQNLKYHS